MSSNMRIQRICQHCKNIFTARTTMTKFCSHTCARLAYKKRVKEEKIQTTKQETKAILKEQMIAPAKNIVIEKELMGIKELALVVGLSERTLFRLIKDKHFPKLRIGKRLLFKKYKVIEYLEKKFGNL